MSNDCNCNIRVLVREDPPILVKMGVESIYSNEYNAVMCMNSFSFGNNSPIEKLILGDLPYATNLLNCLLSNSFIKEFKVGNLPNCTNLQQILRGTTVEDVEIGNLPSLTSFYYGFYDCDSLKKVKIGNMPLNRRMNQLFGSCITLTDLTIGDFSSANEMTGTFTNCRRLTNLTINGNTCAVSFSLGACSLLTHDSVINLFNALPTVDTSPTLVLHANAKERVSLEEMEIATNKGWTVA